MSLTATAAVQGPRRWIARACDGEGFLVESGTGHEPFDVWSPLIDWYSRYGSVLQALERYLALTTIWVRTASAVLISTT